MLWVIAVALAYIGYEIGGCANQIAALSQNLLQMNTVYEGEGKERYELGVPVQLALRLKHVNETLQAIHKDLQDRES
jgi:hypothetical protein